jgi:60 kDa SS-A/Ro ribonucleoprotein
VNYAQHLGPVPQSEPLPGQVKNSAGGHSFPVDDWVRFERFLILGSEGGSYYATERALTLDNCKAVERCVQSNGLRAVDLIVQVSHDGRAPKNDPVLLALAIAMKRGDEATRAKARAVLPSVARIGTHLFHLAEYVKKLGGWGRGTRSAFARWYMDQPVERLVNQVIKYQQRDGWSHRDLLRKAHPKAGAQGELRNSVLNWAVKGWPGVGDEPHPDAVLARIWAFERAKTARGKELVKLIEAYGLPHECVPNEAKNDVAVWAAMLPSMGLTAVIRNLGKMTSVGLLKPLCPETSLVCSQLADPERLKTARIHPLQLLVAQRIYAQGKGDKGSLTWGPVPQITDALDAGFYLAFKAIEPTGKRFMLALDVSGSMGGGLVAGMPGITPRVGSAAMALVTAAVEPAHHVMGFSHKLIPLNISPRQRLDDAIEIVSGLAFGNTDCALPMIYALENKIPVDAFVVYTDSETWCGNIHPVAALQQYRQKMGIGAKLVVVGMVGNPFTIADPNDAGMLDLVGFDTAAPGVISDFASK